MRRSLVSVAVVAVLVLTGCGSGPPQLPLSASGASTKEAAGAADMSMRIANIRYELADGVKADKDKQNAYKQASASRDDAARLAKAFGVTGEIRADEGGWTVGGTGDEPVASDGGSASSDGGSVSSDRKSVSSDGKTALSLYLGKNGSWSMNGNYPVSSGVACAEPARAPEDLGPEPSDCETTTTTINPNLPSEAEARKIAVDKLRAAGIDTDGMKVTVERFDQVASVRFQPLFDGHVVDGFEYGVTVNPERGVAYANGYVGDMKSVGTYDLATLARAVERLNEQFAYPAGDDVRSLAADAIEPAIAPDIAPGEPVPEQPVPEQSEPTIVKLTDVRVGLMMTFDDKDQSLWLTPAYVFKTDQEGGGEVTAAAADDKYLPPPTTVPPSDGDKPGETEPAPVPADPGSGGTSGGNTGSGGGSTGSGGSVEPAPPVKPTAKPPTPPAPSANCASVSGAIDATVCSDKTSYKAGETVTFTITFSDPDRAFVEGPCGDAVTPTYGDSGDTDDVQCLACPTEVPAGPGKGQRQREHTYAKVGSYVASFVIKSGNACGPADPHDSTAKVSLTVKVA